MLKKRNTIQRQLVIAAVRSLSNHPTAEEVYNRIVLDYPDISKGTVYRNLNSLVESGLLRRVSVPGSADCYDHMLTKHYHVQCSRCHKFMNVDDLEYFQDLDDKIAQLTGFRMDNHNLVFQGICPECQIAMAEEQAAEEAAEKAAEAEEAAKAAGKPAVRAAGKASSKPTEKAETRAPAKQTVKGKLKVISHRAEPTPAKTKARKVSKAKRR